MVFNLLLESAERICVAGDIDPEDARRLLAAESTEAPEGQMEGRNTLGGLQQRGFDCGLLSGGGLAEELQGEVNALGADPAEAGEGEIALELVLKLGEGGEDFGGKLDGDEEAETWISHSCYAKE
jgi:hypothetical protein